MGKPKRKEAKLKWTLKYDENEQKDYLLGMRKRKDERRKKAKEEKKELVKEMQRNLRKEKTDFVKNRVKKVKHLLPANIRDEEEEEDDEGSASSTLPSTSTASASSEEVVDYENHTVVVTDLAGNAAFANQPSYRDTLAAGSDEDEDDDEDEDEEEDEEEEESSQSGKGYSVDNYKKKSMELFQKLQRIEGKHVNKKQMFLQRKQKKKMLRKLKRHPKKGAGRNS